MWLQVAVWPEKFTAPYIKFRNTQSFITYAYHVTNFQSASLDNYSSSPSIHPLIFNAFVPAQ